jgi:hypothetical protein
MELNPVTPIGERIRQIILTRKLWGDDTDEEILAFGLIADDTSFVWLLRQAHIRDDKAEHNTYTRWLKGYWNREMARRKDGRRPSTEKILHEQHMRLHP